MLPITYEVPVAGVPHSILRDCWARIVAGYPGEFGSFMVEPPIDGGFLQRITLEVPNQEPVYESLLQALTAINYWARQAWPFPRLYDSGIRYVQEPIGLEIWASTPALFARGVGDCEDLACDLAAQYQLEGIAAWPALELQERTTMGDFWHVVVEHADGTIEDPSTALGMP